MNLHQTDSFEETAGPNNEECQNLEAAVDEMCYLESTTQNAQASNNEDNLVINIENTSQHEEKEAC